MRHDRPLGPSRRRWLGGALGLAGASLLPRPARADRYGPVGGTRILVIGDSMIAGGFGLYLARALGEEHGYDVTRRGKASTGLARPDFFDWMEEAERLVGEQPFDASLVMFGGNDVQGLYMSKDQWIRWQDDGWASEYAKRVAALAERLAPSGQQLFWVGMPVMRPEKLHARVRRVNTIYRAEMAIRHDSEFIDIWSLLAGPDGRYADRIEVPTADGTRTRKVQVRAGDGIHLTVAGAHVLADHVGQVVHAELSGAP
ncbi:MAG: DUF459 domain-containing protein [Myxococcales bacterium]|nr:DUF459 domain-containing protein [Myxococcales bacterium]MCB9718218.1 DUF459 domain-containing protein [Myxococcales bacterium]